MAKPKLGKAKPKKPDTAAETATEKGTKAEVARKVAEKTVAQKLNAKKEEKPPPEKPSTKPAAAKEEAPPAKPPAKVSGLSEEVVADLEKLLRQENPEQQIDAYQAFSGNGIPHDVFEAHVAEAKKRVGSGGTAPSTPEGAAEEKVTTSGTPPAPPGKGDAAKVSDKELLALWKKHGLPSFDEGAVTKKVLWEEIGNSLGKDATPEQINDMASKIVEFAKKKGYITIEGPDVVPSDGTIKSAGGKPPKKPDGGGGTPSGGGGEKPPKGTKPTVEAAAKGMEATKEAAEAAGAEKGSLWSKLSGGVGGTIAGLGSALWVISQLKDMMGGGAQQEQADPSGGMAAWQSMQQGRDQIALQDLLRRSNNAVGGMALPSGSGGMSPELEQLIRGQEAQIQQASVPYPRSLRHIYANSGVYV